jgi:uncharacterized membrane protein
MKTNFSVLIGCCKNVKYYGISKLLLLGCLVNLYSTLKEYYVMNVLKVRSSLLFKIKKNKKIDLYVSKNGTHYNLL